MKYLAFFNTLATGGPVSAAALAIATALDEVLTDSYAGFYKTGIDSNKAIAELQLILKVANQTVEDLSNTADTLYTF
ncbi:hypothetical protein BEL04_08245 [Mucilaginibacter sp. PPCGB 2223]|nr:hypothetical protein BEL04_08245 [Mucilaginibacter sp. PPCGB 2223]